MRKITGIFCLFTAITASASASSFNLSAELKELTGEKRRIADIANELGALARTSHINSWQTHATVLSNLKDVINASGRRIQRIQEQGGASVDVNSVRSELANVAKQVQSLKESLAEDQNAIRMPAYYTAVMNLVRSAETSQVVAERLLASTKGTATTARSSD